MNVGVYAVENAEADEDESADLNACIHAKLNVNAKVTVHANDHMRADVSMYGRVCVLEAMSTSGEKMAVCILTTRLITPKDVSLNLPTLQHLTACKNLQTLQIHGTNPVILCPRDIEAFIVFGHLAAKKDSVQTVSFCIVEHTPCSQPL